MPQPMARGQVRKCTRSAARSISGGCWLRDRQCVRAADVCRPAVRIAERGQLNAVHQRRRRIKHISLADRWRPG